MDNCVFFLPRIGMHYLDGWNGYRTLVLGVHHICSEWNCPFQGKCMNTEGVSEMDDACPVYTDLHNSDYHKLHNGNIIEMNAYIGDEANYPTYSAFTKFMVKKKGYLSREDRANFWEHVVFYNFLQHYLPNGDTPAYVGHEQIYDAAISAFLEMLESLPEKPQVIYAWSKPLYDCLLKHLDQVPGLKVESLEVYPQVMELYYFSLNTPIEYSHEWVDEYIRERIDEGCYVEDRNCPLFIDLLHNALCKGFLAAQNGEIVIPYQSSRNRSAEYGTFLQNLHVRYRMAWKDIEKIVFKLDKEGHHQKQNLRSLPVLLMEDKAYSYIKSFFELKE